jgi:hypothetical protein
MKVSILSFNGCWYFGKSLKNSETIFNNDDLFFPMSRFKTMRVSGDKSLREGLLHLCGSCVTNQPFYDDKIWQRIFIADGNQ